MRKIARDCVAGVVRVVKSKSENISHRGNYVRLIGATGVRWMADLARAETLAQLHTWEIFDKHKKPSTFKLFYRNIGYANDDGARPPASPMLILATCDAMRTQKAIKQQ